jgi:acyl-coenzyme A thioesterase PaaI-like protein
MQVDMYHPTRPGEAGITARVIRLTGHAATVEVTLEQGGRTVSTATVAQVIRR